MLRAVRGRLAETRRAHRPRPRSRPGFTPIELLVLSATIAVLSGRQDIASDADERFGFFTDAVVGNRETED